MAQREERKRLVVVGDRDHGVGSNDVADDVLVAQHHPLRLARRAGGVDDRRQAIGSNRGGRFLVHPAETVLIHQPPVTARRRVSEAQLLADGGDRRRSAARFGTARIRLAGLGFARCVVARRRRVDDDEDGQVGQVLPDGADLGRLGLIGRHRGAGARIGQDVAHLRFRQGRVDRHRHRAARQDGVVGDQPLRAALRQDRDAVSGLDAEGAQTEAEVPDLLEERPRGELRDVRRIGLAAADEDRLRIPAGHVERQIGKRPDFLSHRYSP